jgi:hypothetical protein
MTAFGGKADIAIAQSLLALNLGRESASDETVKLNTLMNRIHEALAL